VTGRTIVCWQVGQLPTRCGERVSLADKTLSEQHVLSIKTCQQTIVRPGSNAALNLYYVAVGQTETLNAVETKQKTISIERAAV
jgi:hypothetical protein